MEIKPSFDFISTGLSFLSTAFIFVIGLIMLFIVIVFIIDITQTKDAVRRNFPVLGHFRYLFSSLGEYFRQYFFAMDREEMPFNRAEREWVARAAENYDNTVAFGSSKNLTPSGTVIFVNCPFPTLEEDAEAIRSMQIGSYCKKTLRCSFFFQYFRYELWGIVNSSGPCSIKGSKDGQLLDEYRRRRAFSLSP